MIDNSNIVILILSTNKPKYQYFKAAIQKTWLQDFKKIGIKCFFYEGDSDSNYIHYYQNHFFYKWKFFLLHFKIHN